MVDGALPLGRLAPALRRMAGLKGDPELLLWEEVRPTMISALKHDETAVSAELGNGDIVTFQVDYKKESGAPGAAAALASKYYTAASFYEYLINKTRVTFRKLSAPRDDVCTLNLDKLMAYGDVAAALAGELGVDADRLEFTPHTSRWDKPATSPMAREVDAAGVLTTNYTLAQMMTNVARDDVAVLYYAELGYSFRDLADHLAVDVDFFSPRVRPVQRVTVLVQAGATMGDLIPEVRKAVADNLSAPDAPLRILSCASGKIQNEHAETDGIADAVEFCDLRAEEVDAEEQAWAAAGADAATRRVVVQHFSQSPLGRPYAATDGLDSSMQGAPVVHGNAFFFLLREGEPFSATRARLRERLDVAKNAFENWKFAFLSPMAAIEILEEDVQLFAHKWGKREVLGLEHVDTERQKYLDNTSIAIAK